MKPQNYSGILLIDGKYVPVKETEGEKYPGLVPRSAKRRGKTKKGLVVISFIDYFTHDIPFFMCSLSENSFDLENAFRKLKEMGYPLKAVVCDESMGKIAEVAKKVFPEVIVQICLTHYERSQERAFKVNHIKRRIQSLERKLQKMENGYLISTHYQAQKKALRIINEVAFLETQYGDLLKVQRLFCELFWQAENLQEIAEKEDELNTFIGSLDLKKHPHRKRIKDRYNDYYTKRDWLVASREHPDLNIPKTTNLIEGFNSVILELRLSSIRGFEKQKYAENYINAIILKYRFHKFTDCKKQFKTLNKKSPLQIAHPLHTLDFDFESGRDWISFCRNFGRCIARP